MCVFVHVRKSSPTSSQTTAIHYTHMSIVVSSRRSSSMLTSTTTTRMIMALLLVIGLSMTTTSVQAFTTMTPTTNTWRQQQPPSTRLLERSEPPLPSVERGVSVDQDGKSNVWAIEPKIEIEIKSNEDQSTAALVAGAGLAVCGAAAALILTNLPDPNQF